MARSRLLRPVPCQLRAGLQAAVADAKGGVVVAAVAEVVAAAEQRFSNGVR